MIKKRSDKIVCQFQKKPLQKKKKSSEGLQIQNSCMGFAIAGWENKM
ncbi:hypothetical protein D2M30_0291 [Bacillus amyloliquefaciens]|nr:hypothetical protein D2M30_0291 [Bacillus amyloliquefaciens]